MSFCLSLNDGPTTSCGCVFLASTRPISNSRPVRLLDRVKSDRSWYSAAPASPEAGLIRVSDVLIGCRAEPCSLIAHPSLYLPDRSLDGRLRHHQWCRPRDERLYQSLEVRCYRPADRLQHHLLLRQGRVQRLQDDRVIDSSRLSPNPTRPRCSVKEGRSSDRQGSSTSCNFREKHGLTVVRICTFWAMGIVPLFKRICHYLSNVR
jgi:hypothetical protein